MCILRFKIKIKQPKAINYISRRKNHNFQKPIQEKLTLPKGKTEHARQIQNRICETVRRTN